MTHPGHFIFIFRGNGNFDIGFFSISIAFPGTLFDQVDDSLKIDFAPDRDLNGDCFSMKTAFNHSDGTIKISADALHFIHKTDARNGVTIGLPPNGFRLRFNTLNRIEHDDTTVKYTKTAFYLGGKIDMSGCVDDVDLTVFPVTGGSRGTDGNAALLFFIHEVHHGGSLVDTPDLISDTGII